MTDRGSVTGDIGSLRRDSDHEVAARRLVGSVWEHVPLALGVYRACLAGGAAFARTGVTANTLTYASLAIAALAGLAAARGSFVVAAGLVALSGAFDMFDGIVARASGTTSRWGALLDSTVDRASDGLPLLGLMVFYAPEGPIMAVPGLALLASFVVSYVRARAEALGTTLPPLFMRRPERVVLLVLSLLAGLLACSRAQLPAPLTMFGMAVLGLSSLAGAVGALRAARGALDEAERRE